LLLLEVFEVDVLEVFWRFTIYVMIDKPETSNTIKINQIEQQPEEFIRELNYFSTEKIPWTELMGPVNHGRVDVFRSVMDQRPWKLACSSKFILADESNQGSSTWSYDEHKQGIAVLTNSSERRRDGSNGPSTRSRAGGAWSPSMRRYGREGEKPMHG
jgi:hypothetical protein